jgi:hypothetical protein
MDNNGLLAALGSLSSICTKPDQLQFLSFLATQPPENIQTVLRTYASQIEPDKLPAVVDSEFPNLSPEQRAVMVNQAVQAYNFLKAQAQ